MAACVTRAQSFANDVATSSWPSPSISFLTQASSTAP